MKIPLIMFLLILVTIIFVKWRQNREKEPEEKVVEIEKAEKSKPKEMGVMEMIIRISAAGAIFLALIYVMRPEIIIGYHKQIIVFVILMIANATLLGVKQEWEKNSTRKIMRAHLAIYSIILILAVLYSDPEVRSWVEDFQPNSALQPQAVIKYPNCPETRDKETRVGRKTAKTPLWLDCYSVRIILPAPENGAGKVAFEVSDQLHGIKFCNNEEWDRDRFVAALSHDGWLSHLPCSSFRLRGKGEAKIFIY